jgi:hypothetical protein
MTMRTLQELAQEAIDIQNACNPLGLSKGYAKALQELRELLEQQGYTDVLCKHPINQLWASKLHDLARMGLSDTDCYGKAYDACLQMAKGDK